MREFFTELENLVEFMEGFPGGSAGKESTCNAGELGSIPGLERSPGEGTATHSNIRAWKIPWTIESMESQRVGHNWATFTFLGFSGSSAGKESACNAGDPSSIPGKGRSTGEGVGYPLQYSWASLVAQLVKNQPAMREMWVPSLGWEDPLKKEWPPTPGFWPGESHGLCSPRTCKESDRAERLSLLLSQK